MHRTHINIVENFHERNVVMTTHINGWHNHRSAPCMAVGTGGGGAGGPQYFANQKYLSVSNNDI